MLIGKVTHYYDKIGVAVVELSNMLKVGDEVKIEGHGKEFKQKVTSMQIEHEKISEAKKGETVGLKVDELVKEGDLLHRIE